MLQVKCRLTLTPVSLNGVEIKHYLKDLESQKMKKWYLSKTVWLGVLGIATSVVIAIDQGLSLTQVLLAGLGAATILIRGVTKLPLGK